MKERDLLREVEIADSLMLISKKTMEFANNAIAEANAMSEASINLFTSIREELGNRAVVSLCNRTHRETLRRLLS